MITLLFSSVIFAQPSDRMKSINDNYRTGEQLLLELKHKQALKYFEQALKIDPQHTASLRAAGTCYDLLGQYEKALGSYLKVLDQNPYFSRIIYYEIGRTYYRLGQYHSALGYFSQFGELQNLNNSYFGLSVEREIQKEAEYLRELSQSMLACQISIDSVQYHNIREVVNVGPAINTNGDEYFPYLVNNNVYLYYTKRQDIAQKEDVFVSEKLNNVWQAGQSLTSLNTKVNEGMTTFVRDGKKMYFTACERENVKGACDIWEAEAEGKKVKKIQTVADFLNSDSWDAQASISCDGNVIYFASNRPGGYGGTDIWISQKEEDGKWSEPKNMGANVNTAGDEEAPFITNDGKMLYFSSTGHFGMGEQDIYFVRKQKDGLWSKPYNLGPPVNSAARELGFFLSADGKVGYFSSDREGGYGGMDIYKFELPAQLTADPITFVEGFVKDKDFGLPVRTKVSIKGRPEIETDERGRFFVCFPANTGLKAVVNQMNFSPYQHTFDIPEWDNTKPFTIDILLEMSVHSFSGAQGEKSKQPEVEVAEKPKPVDLQKVSTLSIYYETNEATLNSRNKNHLDRFLGGIEKDKITKIEIIGYADSVGSDGTNVVLSENRAKNVATFLKDKELVINKVYLEGRGTSNDSQNNAENRRVEIIIHSKM